MNFIFNENQIAYYSEDGKILAEITFPYIDSENRTVEINHTFVDESLRGQGIAGKMMEALSEYLKEHSVKAVPTCSYAAAWFSKHPEASNILKK